MSMSMDTGVCKGTGMDTGIGTGIGMCCTL